MADPIEKLTSAVKRAQHLKKGGGGGGGGVSLTLEHCRNFSILTFSITSRRQFFPSLKRRDVGSQCRDVVN